MKKLLELKKLDTKVRRLLRTVKTPPGIYTCLHLHYTHPTISIYRDNLGGELKPTTELMLVNVVFTVDIDIDEQIVNEIVAQIKKVMQ